MSMTPPLVPPQAAQWVQCACGVVYQFGTVHQHGVTAAAPPMPTDGMSPTGPTPEEWASMQDEMASLSDRVAALEGWVSDDAMTEIDGMQAALPEAKPAAKYDADQLRALAEKDQVFNKDELNFPIGDCEDVQNAVQALGRADADHAAVKGYIIGVAEKINCVESLPQDWVEESSQVGA